MRNVTLKWWHGTPVIAQKDDAGRYLFSRDELLQIFQEEEDRDADYKYYELHDGKAFICVSTHGHVAGEKVGQYYEREESGLYELDQNSWAFEELLV